MSLDEASSDLHLELPPEQLLWNVPQVVKYPTGLTGLSCSGLCLPLQENVKGHFSLKERGTAFISFESQLCWFLALHA